MRGECRTLLPPRQPTCRPTAPRRADPESAAAPEHASRPPSPQRQARCAITCYMPTIGDRVRMMRRHALTPLERLARIGFLGEWTVLGNTLLTTGHSWVQLPGDDLRLLAELQGRPLGVGSGLAVHGAATRPDPEPGVLRPGRRPAGRHGRRSLADAQRRRDVATHLPGRGGAAELGTNHLPWPTGSRALFTRSCSRKGGPGRHATTPRMRRRRDLSRAPPHRSSSTAVRRPPVRPHHKPGRGRPTPRSRVGRSCRRRRRRRRSRPG